MTWGGEMCCDYEEWSDGTFNCNLFVGGYTIPYGGNTCWDDDSTADIDGDICSNYDETWCGGYDDDDFSSYSQCCVCGGGYVEEGDSNDLFASSVFTFGSHQGAQQLVAASMLLLTAYVM